MTEATTREDVERAIDYHNANCKGHHLPGALQVEVEHGPHEPLGVLSATSNNKVALLFRTVDGPGVPVVQLQREGRLGGTSGALCVCRHCGCVYFQHGPVML